MRISQLEYFISAAKNHSFSKAARDCFTVQSAISQQITALEEELGFLLFERTAKGIELTPAGVRYYADTVQLLEKLNENRRAAAQIAHGISGTLKVGIAGANQAAFMGSLKCFYQENPALSIEFLDVSTEHQVDELRSGYYDILHTAVFNMSGLENEIAFADRYRSVLAVFMSREHPLAQQENVCLEELAEITGCENLAATVREYDGYVAAGEDPVFHKQPALMQPIGEEGSFYLFEYNPSAFNTFGGCRTDHLTRALKPNFEVIPGLYIAGVENGSLYSSPYYDVGGTCNGLSLASGRLSGMEMAKFVSE